MNTKRHHLKYLIVALTVIISISLYACNNGNIESNEIAKSNTASIGKQKRYLFAAYWVGMSKKEYKDLTQEYLDSLYMSYDGMDTSVFYYNFTIDDETVGFSLRMIPTFNYEGGLTTIMFRTQTPEDISNYRSYMESNNIKPYTEDLSFQTYTAKCFRKLRDNISSKYGQPEISKNVLKAGSLTNENVSIYQSVYKWVGDHYKVIEATANYGDSKESRIKYLQVVYFGDGSYYVKKAQEAAYKRQNVFQDSLKKERAKQAL